MSQAHATMSTVEIPPNVRTAVLSRAEILCLSIRIAFSSLVFSVFCGVYCVVISIIHLYGGRELLYIEPLEYLTIAVIVCFFYLFIISFSLFWSFRKLNKHGIPIAHGFTKDILFRAGSNHQALYRWDFFTRWKEMKACFLLYDTGRWLIFPKAMWTSEEIDEIRSIMREKVGKPYTDAG